MKTFKEQNRSLDNTFTSWENVQAHREMSGETQKHSLRLFQL